VRVCRPQLAPPENERMIETQQILNEWFIEECFRLSQHFIGQAMHEWDAGEHPQCHFHRFMSYRPVKLWMEWCRLN